MLELVSFTDVHHDVYANGLTMEDVIAVENQVLQASIDRGRCPILFCGDRFVDSNPADVVKVAADAAMLKKCRYEIDQFYLVGNHDRWTRAIDSGNTYSHVDLYQREFGNWVTVMDKVQAYQFPKYNLAIHAIPAGGFAKPIEFKFDPKIKINICAFHDIYKNAVIDARSGRKHEGVAHSVMDDQRFSLVVGGDNHVPQDLGFQNTRGIHLGSALQHNWGDSGSPRGFWTFTFNDEGKILDQQFHESCAPKFIRHLFVIDDPVTFESWVIDQLADTTGNIARIHVQGEVTRVTAIDRLALERRIRERWSPRRIQVVLEPWIKKLEIAEVVAQQAKSMNHEERWATFVDARGFSNSVEMKVLGVDLIKKARSL